MENPTPPDPDNHFWSRRRWLIRLSFSFLVIACYLAYAAYRGSENRTMTHGRALLLYFAAMLAFVMFVVGARERHR